MKQDAPLACAIGLGACLLFQIQFLLARQILPWFGGAPAVWSTSLVVFQALLLAGYAWAHGLARLPSRRSQARLQAMLVALTLALLAWRALVWPSPVMPGEAWKPAGDGSPVLAISTLLVAAIGLPFLALASTSPLLQRWHADRLRQRVIGDDAVDRRRSWPYRWYAVSNAGSLIGLLSYPLVVEPRLDVFQQGRWWTVAYAIFAAAMLACAWQAHRSVPTDAPTVDVLDAPASVRAADWRASSMTFLLAALPASLLQATTTLITQDIAAVPFLWMVPLALYLLTYIVAFERPEAYRRQPLAMLLMAGSLLSLWRWPTLPTIMLTLAMLLLGGLALHGELARRAPPAGALTRYYLTIAAGGVAGSALVAFGAPLAFTRVIEYPVTLAAMLLLLALTHWTARSSVLVVADDSRTAKPILPDRQRRRERLHAEGLVLTALVVIAATTVESRLIADQVTHASRSFFGTVRVREMNAPDGARYRRLIHGTTLHGLQYLDGARRHLPTAYFTASSGIGQAMAAVVARPNPVRVVVLGLGIGTLAAYGRANDRFSFYEIDPQVVALSTGPDPVFTYVRDSAAMVDLAVGDGRLLLERAPPLGADILVADAFSSDAVPVHLLTREAMALYVRHLRDRSAIVAVHISNRYLALADVVAAAGQANGMTAVLVEDAEVPGIVRATDWMLLSRDPAALRTFGTPYATRSRPWTDAWSDPWRAFHW